MAHACRTISRIPRWNQTIRSTSKRREAMPTPITLCIDFRNRRIAMPRGDKSAYTDKQKRQVQHIEEGYEQRGVPKKEAQRRAWATENKISGGGKKSGSGRGQHS
jgi:hypothetical protein